MGNTSQIKTKSKNYIYFNMKALKTQEQKKPGRRPLLRCKPEVFQL